MQNTSSPAMSPAMAQVVQRAEQDIDSHLRNLRHKLERMTAKGLPTERLESRISRESAMLERLRQYAQKRHLKPEEAI